MAFGLERELPEAFDTREGGTALGLFVTIGNSPACGGENRHVNAVLAVVTGVERLEVSFKDMEGILIRFILAHRLFAVFREPVMKFFGRVAHVEIFWFDCFWIISILFLVLAIVPSFAIADLGIRGKFSTGLLSMYSMNTVGILGTTFGIWFINLFVPALAGKSFPGRRR